MHHPDELAMLAAIHASPKDDLRRLVYADWLDENGDPDHAELIRLQIASSESNEVDAKLVARVRRKRISPVPTGFKLLCWDRGLPIFTWTRIVFDEVFDRLANQAVANLPPLGSLSASPIICGLGELQHMLAHPVMARVSSMTLHLRGSVTDQWIHAIAAAPHLTRLVQLCIRPGVTPEVSRTLATVLDGRVDVGWYERADPRGSARFYDSIQEYRQCSG